MKACYSAIFYIAISWLPLGCWTASDSIEIYPEIPESTEPETAVEKEQVGISVIGYSPPLTWVQHRGGRFEMGGRIFLNEAPIHEVTVPAFSMLKTEVTVGQYRICVSSGECDEPESCGDRFTWRDGAIAKSPINCISKADASAFCRFAGGTLPTEAQWEYAAGGEFGNIYPWGDADPTCDLAIMSSEELEENETLTPKESWGCDTGSVELVCSKTLGNTPLGLCDMAGNLAEWVADAYHETYEDAPLDGSAWIEDGEDDVVRGGAFFGTATDLTVQRRRRVEKPGSDIGFRCTRNL